MSHNNFVNRSNELSYLQGRYESDRSEMIIIYGRRRIGKTELLSKFLSGKCGLYLLATMENESQNIQIFAREFARFLGDDNFAAILYPSFESLFTSVISHNIFQSRALSEKVIIVIDEYSYLIEKNSAIPSIFQRIWDLYLSKLPIMLVLSGSAISIMEQEVMGYKSPLFGRRTGQWQVEPLSFSHLSELIPWDIEDLARVWFVAGGVPAYLNQFDPKTDFWNNISHLYFEKGSYLYVEAELLLHYEFREAANYLTIMRAIAHGYSTIGEIISDTALDRSLVSKYLSVLIRLHMVRDEIPVTSPPNTRKRHYRLIDQYLSFWFRYIYPEKASIESRQTGPVLQRVMDSFPHYCGHLFEDLVEHLIRNGAVLAEYPIGKLGRWWYKDTEIDLVSIHEPTGTMICIECKWSDLNGQEAEKVLKDLKEKSEHVRWKNETRTTVHMLMGKSIQGKDALRKKGYIVHDLSDLCTGGS